MTTLNAKEFGAKKAVMVRSTIRERLVFFHSRFRLNFLVIIKKRSKYTSLMMSKTEKNKTKSILSYRKFWAHRLTPAPFLPMSLEEMDLLGWDSCDIIIVTGDAYVDHASFGMAIVGRFLESQGFDFASKIFPRSSREAHVDPKSSGKVFI